MNWINLNVAVLDSEEFIGSDQCERGTWLCLMRYCCGQENGGRIEAAKEWKDRKWQQIARVTLKEVQASCDLWRWEGDDLIVEFYPEDKEAEVRQKRENAKTNGALGGRPKKTDVGTNIGTDVGLEKKPTTPKSPKAERERKEKGREGEGEMEAAAPSAPAPKPSASTFSDSMPTETAKDFDTLSKQINSLHPQWTKRPAMTYDEQQTMLTNSKALFALDDPDWALLKAYLASSIPESWGKFWQPDSRSIFLQKVSDVLNYADRWKGECKRRNVKTGIEEVAS